jgi:hypothetical protein
MTKFKNGQEVECFDHGDKEWVIADYACPHPKIKGKHVIWTSMDRLVVIAEPDIRHLPLPDWPMDHPIEVSRDGDVWIPAHFKRWGRDRRAVVWDHGRTTHTGAKTEKYQYYRENEKEQVKNDRI